jgi:hypothetical protein
MTSNIQMTLRQVRRMARSFARDWHQAQRLLLEYQLAPERFVFRPCGMPATYAEFLFVTAGPRPHEPSARARDRDRERTTGRRR